jgi:hypothetical protein
MGHSAVPTFDNPLQGMLRGQELREAYASADIFMMPSESETLGFVVLEVHNHAKTPN